jgi:hypothetical protein
MLDEYELRTGLRRMFKLLGVNENSVNINQCLENVMIALDSNKDSKISRTEFIEGVLSDNFLYTLFSPFS